MVGHCTKKACCLSVFKLERKSPVDPLDLSILVAVVLEKSAVVFFGRVLEGRQSKLVILELLPCTVAVIYCGPWLYFSSTSFIVRLERPIREEQEKRCQIRQWYWNKIYLRFIRWNRYHDAAGADSYLILTEGPLGWRWVCLPPLAWHPGVNEAMPLWTRVNLKKNNRDVSSSVWIKSPGSGYLWESDVSLTWAWRVLKFKVDFAPRLRAWSVITLWGRIHALGSTV